MLYLAIFSTLSKLWVSLTRLRLSPLVLRRQLLER